MSRDMPRKRSMLGIFRRNTAKPHEAPLKPSPNSPMAQIPDNASLSEACETLTHGRYLSPKSLNSSSPNFKAKICSILLDIGVSPKHIPQIMPLKDKPEIRDDIPIKAHQLLGIEEPSGPAVSRWPGYGMSVYSKRSRIYKLRQLSPKHNFPVSPNASNKLHKYTPLYEELMQQTLKSCSHLLNFNGPFTQNTAFSFHRYMLLAPTSLSQEISFKFGANISDRTKAEPFKLTRLEEELADDAALELPVREQYKIYLFERILLCCKEINPNKAKNKMLSTNKPLVDKKGKPKLQLKGRIFMQNVTDVIFIMNKKSGKVNMLLWCKSFLTLS